MSTNIKQHFLRRPWMRFLLLGVLASTVLSSCAFRRLIYERLDWVIVYQLDSYVDLNDEQEAKFRKPLKDTIAWFKKERIPQMLALVERLEKAAGDKNLDAAGMEHATTAIAAWRQEIGARLEQPAEDLALSLYPGQIKRLKKRLEKSNEDLIELLAEDDEDFPEELEDDRKKQIKSLEYWYGSFSDEQKKLLHESLGSNRAKVQERLEQRQRLHRFVLETLESKDKERINGMIKAWVQTGEPWDDKDYRNFRTASARRWQKLLPELHKTLSDKQWAKLKERFVEIRNDIHKLADS